MDNQPTYASPTPLSPQTPANPQMPPIMPNPAPKSSKKKSFLLIVLALVLIAAAGFGGYTFEHQQATKREHNQQAQINKLQKQIDSLQKQSSTTTSSTAASNTYTGWKSYTLKYEKLTFKYPSSWTISDQSTAGHDIVTITGSNGFAFNITDGIQNGGDPLSLASNDPVSVTYLGKPAYVVFIHPKVAQSNGPATPDASVVGNAMLMLDPNTQPSDPPDKNVLGSSQNNGVNGPEGSYMSIFMGYNGKNNMSLQAATADSQFKNGELIIESMHY